MPSSSASVQITEEEATTTTTSLTPAVDTLPRTIQAADGLPAPLHNSALAGDGQINKKDEKEDDGRSSMTSSWIENSATPESQSSAATEVLSMDVVNWEFKDKDEDQEIKKSDPLGSASGDEDRNEPADRLRLSALGLSEKLVMGAKFCISWCSRHPLFGAFIVLQTLFAAVPVGIFVITVSAVTVTTLLVVAIGLIGFICASSLFLVAVLNVTFLIAVVAWVGCAGSIIGFQQALRVYNEYSAKVESKPHKI